MIQKRMAKEVTTDGSPVWDPKLDTVGSNESTTDELGAFASLATDEDRERKAECARPGTYNVVVNPSSFKHLPEYSVKEELISSVPGDPNTVVLRQFEGSFSQTRIKIEDDEVSTKPDPDASLMHQAAEGGHNWKYLLQFRNVVWRQLIVQAKLESGDEPSSTDVLERVATYFPPVRLQTNAKDKADRQQLFHAMMAMTQHHVKARVDALKHYGESISALQSNLRTENDWFSDGAFLTHFLLLVYEVCSKRPFREEGLTQADCECRNMSFEHVVTTSLDAPSDVETSAGDIPL
jgi:hypothetical protein